jgi:transcription elongation factor Elf1
MTVPDRCPHCNGYKTVINCLGISPFDKYVYCYNCMCYFKIDTEIDTEISVTDDTMPRWM